MLDQLKQPRLWAPTLVLGIGVALTALTATELHRSEQGQRSMQESNLADGFGALLQMHLAGCEEALRTAGLLAGAEPRLDTQSWQAIGRQLRVGEFDACAKAIVHVDAGTGRTLVAPAEAPPGDATGFDPLRDPAQRAAMDAARELGQPRLSVQVAWPGVAPGTPLVVWYMPVYRHGAVVDSAEARAAATTGYVGIPIRVSDVAQALSRQLPDAELQVECLATGEMFARDGATTSPRDRTLRIGGRWWTLHAGLAAAPTGWLEALRPSTIGLAAGLSLSALLAWLTWLMLTQSARAHALARRHSRDANEREARLRSLLDGTRDGIFTLDLHGCILGANRAAQEMLGYPEAETRGRSISTLVEPQRVPEYHALWLEFVRTARADTEGHGPVSEIELCRRDGRVLRVRSSLSLVRTENGDFAVWMVGDVTREREMERRAHEAAALNQAIMDAAPIGVMTIGADGGIATANRATHAMFGYAAGELVGRGADIFDDPAAAKPTDAGEFDSGTPAAGAYAQEAEQTYVRKDGSRFPAGVIALPLFDTEGRSLGGLRMVMDITERKRAAARIEHLAMHDALTGVSNRLMLQERAGQMLARTRRHPGSGFALALVDLDRFKQVNDTLGHSIGDELLRVVAQRLTYAVRASDTIARMGGDEFALLLPDIVQPEQAVEVARKALAALAEELMIEGNRLHVTASIGVALFPQHGDDLPALLKSADLAMYDAKGSGRAGVSLYQERMSREGGEELELRADLHQALERNELVLHYQPLVRAADNEVEGLEALLRWKHPTRGLVSPAQFIPLAESTGLIVPIGAWVLRQACADLARLRRQGHPALRMAVNLSPRQFTTEGLETHVAEALQAAGLPGDALELEITESVLMNSVERTQRLLQALRATGVSIAIDDFGTGYSSLSYLASFPVQTVKVDRAFVRQLDSGEGTALLAGTIVAMAHSLGCGVVAEGVETDAQHQHLVELNCELLQGFRFSKPVPIEQLADAIARVEAMPLPAAARRVEVWGKSEFAAI